MNPWTRECIYSARAFDGLTHCVTWTKLPRRALRDGSSPLVNAAPYPPRTFHQVGLANPVLGSNVGLKIYDSAANLGCKARICSEIHGLGVSHESHTLACLRLTRFVEMDIYGEAFDFHIDHSKLFGHWHLILLPLKHVSNFLGES